MPDRNAIPSRVADGIFDKIVADVKRQERQRIRHALEVAIEAGDYYEPEHDVVAFDLPLLMEIIGDV